MSKAISVRKSEGRPVGDMVRLRHFGCRSADLGLLHDLDDLIFSESLPLHAEFSLIF